MNDRVRRYMALAAKVLGCIKANDPSFYTANEALAEAWAMQLARTTLTEDDLLDAVAQWYATPHDRHPRAADIVLLAKASWRDRFDRESIDGPLHRALEARADAKAAPDEPQLALTAAGQAELEASSPELRSAIIEGFRFRPKQDQAVVCRTCAAELTQAIGTHRGAYVHPGGELHCPAKTATVEAEQ